MPATAISCAVPAPGAAPTSPRPADFLPALRDGLGWRVQAVDGREFTDLTIGYGAVFMGHRHPAITAAVSEAAQGLWACGRHPTPALAAAMAAVGALLRTGMHPLGFCSTGMEAAEFALRVAAVHTGRRGFIGFQWGMHGKSAMTAALCWPNAPLPSAAVTTLPFVDTLDEGTLLARLEDRLRACDIAAVVLEPIQGSNGGHEASPAFHAALQSMCERHGSLLVVDEVLTGLYRTGPCFHSDALQRPPDLLIFAKSMANGLPVAAVAAREGIEAGPASLPGSTFAGNPLVAAGVVATLAAMQGADLPACTAAIGTAVQTALAPVLARGALLRGRGALWLLELPSGTPAVAVQQGLVDAGILATLSGGRHLRLLPAATMPPSAVQSACSLICQCVLDAAP